MRELFSWWSKGTRKNIHTVGAWRAMPLQCGYFFVFLCSTMKTVLACYTGVSFIHFLFMTSLKNMSKDPTFKVGAMIVALTVMCAVGFFVLYFKSELDVQQTGQEIGI